MDFELGEEQVMLKTSARDFLEKECPRKLVREMMDDEKGYSPELWQKMARLGWQGLVFPEEYGGSGSTFLDLAVLLEEMGRALVPGPFFATVVLAGRLLLAAASQEQKQRYLPGIARGDTIMTLAHAEAGGGLEATDVQVRATARNGGYTINGTKLFVPCAHVAHHLIVSARTGDSAEDITLFLVDAGTEGTGIEVLKTLTGHKLCEVTFSNVNVPPENIIGKLNQGWPRLSNLLAEAAIAESAWMAGGAQWVLETSVEYARERVQFGRPIGSFQAIQHKLANMAVAVEGATAFVYYAAWTVSEDDPDKMLAASVAKAWCSDTYLQAAYDGIQVHGGIGFTWDHDMHLYLKQARQSQVAYGDADYHREKVAQLLDV